MAPNDARQDQEELEKTGDVMADRPEKDKPERDPNEFDLDILKNPPLTEREDLNCRILGLDRDNQVKIDLVGAILSDENSYRHPPADEWRNQMALTSTGMSVFSALLRDNAMIMSEPCSDRITCIDHVHNMDQRTHVRFNSGDRRCVLFEDYVKDWEQQYHKRLHQLRWMDIGPILQLNREEEEGPRVVQEQDKPGDASSSENTGSDGCG